MDISIYSKSTDEKIIKQHSQLTEKYGRDLQDNSKPPEERRLVNLVKRKVSPDKQEQELFSIREFVKEYLYRKSKELALIIFLAMEKLQDFGIMGEQRVLISFMRNILSIPNNREVNQFDADRFRRVLDEFDRCHGNKSGEDYLDYLKHYSLEIFGKTYPVTDFIFINELLDLLDVDYYFFNTHNHPYGVRFILGKFEKFNIGQKKVYKILREYIRSPQFVLSIAAEVFKDSTMIRQEACEVIFFNKWQKFFSQSVSECNSALRHIISSIRDGVIEKVLSLYKAACTKETLKIREIFINEMIDGILWHEIGHHISYADMGPEYLAFHYNFIEDDNIGTVLVEALADWAPEKDEYKGAFAHFVELSKTDFIQAARNILTYISDNWFVDDEDEEFMSLMSNILVGLAMSFINQDGTVDFDRMEKEKDQIYTFLKTRFKHLVDKLLAVIRNSYYKMGVQTLSYFDMENELYEMYQKGRNARSIDELHRFSFFWMNVVGYLEKYSVTGWEQYQNVLNEEACELERMILKEIIKVDEAKYKNSLREYIVERAKEIGIVKAL